MSELLRANALLTLHLDYERRVQEEIEKFLRNIILPIAENKGYVQFAPEGNQNNPLIDQKWYFRVKPESHLSSINENDVYFYVGIKFGRASPKSEMPYAYMYGKLPNGSNGFHREIDLTNSRNSFETILSEYVMQLNAQ